MYQSFYCTFAQMGAMLPSRALLSLPKYIQALIMKRIMFLFSILLPNLFIPLLAVCQTSGNTGSSGEGMGDVVLLVIMILLLLAISILLVLRSAALSQQNKLPQREEPNLKKIISGFNKEQIEKLLRSSKFKKASESISQKVGVIALVLLSTLFPAKQLFAQTTEARGSLFTEGGILITLLLIATPILVGIVLMVIKVNRMGRQIKMRKKLEEAEQISNYLQHANADEVAEELEKRKEVLDFQLTRSALSGDMAVKDERGLLQNINEKAGIRFIEEKKKAIPRPEIDRSLSKLIIWYIITATIWLIFGTTVGEYIGIKFVAPDVDHVSWLGFGRLRPVHTNAVFWGWSSLAMIGLGYYVIPRVGNNKLYSIKWGWWSLWLINGAVLIGSLFLMAGINNSGGEFREYIWPVQALFGIAVIISLVNYIKTIARRKTKEIYVSNWYIVAAMMFGITITLVAYLPWWQQGLGETISQGYYMHQGVGMWFMMFVLGLIYYFLPQQLNKPIYSYSLGILAFWTQILFYTLIGSHHFVFSSIPWWLQTIAIVGSVGMIIPVVAGTTNFLMTFKGSWHKLSGSYTLPFMLIGIIFYFTGSMQGTAEAFRTTNLYWHFTDFTVAHSHLTMYGIIAFFLWGFIYAVLPRLTRREPPQASVGLHFWMAFIGLMFYVIPLMIGGTLKGISWMEGNPFIESVILMAPYWLWRAIGGTLMWIAHLVFAYNVYKMIRPSKEINLNDEIVERVEQKATSSVIGK